jgi:Fur family transcriptional regulator, ferric uptake regulator
VGGGLVNDLDETVARRLRAIKQRYTTGRQALVKVLADEGQPMSIPEVLDRQGDVPQSSAYRNLAVLEQAGVVHRIASVGDFARYELAEDLTEHHHHLICSTCGNVEDFTASAAVERTLRKVAGDVTRDAGFRADSHRLDLVGRCKACA